MCLYFSYSFQSQIKCLVAHNFEFKRKLTQEAVGLLQRISTSPRPKVEANFPATLESGVASAWPPAPYEAANDDDIFGAGAITKEVDPEEADAYK
eukprot:gene5084-34881_t